MPPINRRHTLLRCPLLLSLITVALISSCPAAAPTPFPEPSSASSLFQNRPIGPMPPPTATPTPKHYLQPDEKGEPIPRSWWIGGIAAVALAIVALLYLATRSWRSSNLFDRQYRFPTGGKAALRLGAVRSGGHMATLRFDGETLPPASKPEDV